MKKTLFCFLMLSCLLFVPSIAKAEKYVEVYDEIIEHNSELENYIEFSDTYSTYELKSLEGEVSAILIQFYNNGEALSYIVISCSLENDFKVIEFGTGVASHIIRIIADENVCEESYDLLYLEELRYVAKYKDKYYIVQNGCLESYDSLPEDWICDSENTQYYEYQDTLTWSEVLKKEDSGYTGGNRKWAPGASAWNSNYKTMTFFGTGGICSSTAAYNLATYWYGQGYTNFEPITASKQKKLFNAFYKELGEGAIISKCQYAYEIVFQKYGYTAITKYTQNASWTAITSAINSGPIHVHLRNSQIYGNHGVMGVGYVSFAFPSGWTSRYIIIVDGWNNGFRYVNYSLGIDGINITTVKPYKFQPQIVPTPSP